MTLFLSTYVNKVDRKGRVSVPASFRAALQGQSFHGIVAFRSYKDSAIIGCGMDFMERLSTSVTDLDLFSDAQDDLSATIFADAHQLSLDGDGRILLAQNLADHAEITDQAAFVGRGETFEIWQPEAFNQRLAAARGRAKSQGATLSLRPRGNGE
ncbi:MAG: division/cell wall cluster transcriptional repressor MraZ [Alphaproteobacteria bacterium]|nr:division/cell wall cluster transcriptional repressor MraZ [Alphaproteobacteria bacterium]